MKLDELKTNLENAGMQMLSSGGAVGPLGFCWTCDPGCSTKCVPGCSDQQCSNCSDSSCSGGCNSNCSSGCSGSSCSGCSVLCAGKSSIAIPIPTGR